MGPYCKFCQTRCFVPMPNDTPFVIFDAYRAAGGTVVDIVATCEGGKAYEKEKTGYCHTDIQEQAQEVQYLDRLMRLE